MFRAQRLQWKHNARVVPPPLSLVRSPVLDVRLDPIVNQVKEGSRVLLALIHPGVKAPAQVVLRDHSPVSPGPLHAVHVVPTFMPYVAIAAAVSLA
jgi:hypothetical protein